MSEFQEEYKWFAITVEDYKYKLYNPVERYVMYALSLKEARKKIDMWYKSR